MLSRNIGARRSAMQCLYQISVSHEQVEEVFLVLLHVTHEIFQKSNIAEPLHLLILFHLNCHKTLGSNSRS